MLTLEVKYPDGKLKIYSETRYYSTDGIARTKGDMDLLVEDYKRKDYNFTMR